MLITGCSSVSSWPVFLFLLTDLPLLTWLAPDLILRILDPDLGLYLTMLCCLKCWPWIATRLQSVLLLHVCLWPGYWPSPCYTPVLTSACLLTTSQILALTSPCFQLDSYTVSTPGFQGFSFRCHSADCQPRPTSGVVPPLLAKAQALLLPLTQLSAPMQLCALCLCLHPQGCSDQSHKGIPLVFSASNQGTWQIVGRGWSITTVCSSANCCQLKIIWFREQAHFGWSWECLYCICNTQKEQQVMGLLVASVQVSKDNKNKGKS